MKKTIVSALGVAALSVSAFAASAATLDDVKAKGFVQCGVSQGLPGFSNPDSAVTGQALTLIFVVVLLQQYLVMHQK